MRLVEAKLQESCRVKSTPPRMSRSVGEFTLMGHLGEGSFATVRADCCLQI